MLSFSSTDTFNLNLNFVVSVGSHEVVEHNTERSCVSSKGNTLQNYGTHNQNIGIDADDTSDSDFPSFMHVCPSMYLVVFNFFTCVCHRAVPSLKSSFLLSFHNHSHFLSPISPPQGALFTPSLITMIKITMILMVVHKHLSKQIK